MNVNKIVFHSSTHIYLHYKNGSFTCINLTSQVVEQATYSFPILKTEFVS